MPSHSSPQDPHPGCNRKPTTRSSDYLKPIFPCLLSIHDRVRLLSPLRRQTTATSLRMAVVLSSSSLKALRWRSVHGARRRTCLRPCAGALMMRVNRPAVIASGSSSSRTDRSSSAPRVRGRFSTTYSPSPDGSPFPRCLSARKRLVDDAFSKLSCRLGVPSRYPRFQRRRLRLMPPPLKAALT